MPKNLEPLVLKSACILSFAGSGAGFLLYLAAGVFFGHTADMIVRFSSWDTAGQTSPWYFLLLALLHGVSFTGVSLMWNLRTTGFIVYTLAQTGIVMLPPLWLGWDAFSAVSFIFTILFVSIYLLQFLKYRFIPARSSRSDA